MLLTDANNQIFRTVDPGDLRKNAAQKGFTLRSRNIRVRSMIIG